MGSISKLLQIKIQTISYMWANIFKYIELKVDMLKSEHPDSELDENSVICLLTQLHEHGTRDGTCCTSISIGQANFVHQSN